MSRVGKKTNFDFRGSRVQIRWNDFEGKGSQGTTSKRISSEYADRD